MKRIFSHRLSLLNTPSINYWYNTTRINPQLQSQVAIPKQTLFHKKTFPQIITIIKNPDNPYPKNSTYYHAIFTYILDESTNNSKVMLQYGDAIHIFLQDIMERIKTMDSKELSEMLILLKLRPKALRFEKQLLIAIHLRFQARIKELIELNEQKKCTPQDALTIEDVKNQVLGLFYLKKNTSILDKVLNFTYNLLLTQKQVTDMNDPNQVYAFKQSQFVFEQILFIVNQNLDDTIDPIRESIAQFAKLHYNKKTLTFNPEILRMIVKSKFYKNYPIVRNEDWIHTYVFKYLQKLIAQQNSTDIQEFISVLKSCITYVIHSDPYSKDKFLELIDIGYQIGKKNLLKMSHLDSKEKLKREINSISSMIKLTPSYLYIKHYYSISTIHYTKGNKVDSNYIKLLIKELKPILKQFVINYFELESTFNEEGVEIIKFKKGIDENIQVLNQLIDSNHDPEKLLLKSVENLLNIVTVFKDYELTNIDTDFVLLLIETETIYCMLCRKYIADEVRFLRLIEHSVFVLGELEKQLKSNYLQYKQYEPKMKLIKKKMEEELLIYDNLEKTYKPFTVLRLVSTLKCMNIKPKFLGDFYKNVKFKKPNIYVETLSRTMLKGYNYHEIIDAFSLIFQGKISVKQIELGRIVFLSSKEPLLLKYWIHDNRQELINKICFCRKIIANIVSIIRMDNLEINRNSIQILSEIIIENKLFEIHSPSISNHQQSNQLKKILCNNFSILFRYSKMDSMIDDIFVVHKNVPTLFRNKFSHIETMKILSFSTYLSEEQSIFYINRQNKNALFKFVIMLMKKVPYCLKSKNHYLLGQGFQEQLLMLDVVGKIIEQYWPDNKLTNKAMPFYSQFLAFYVKIHKFDLLIKSENTLFLIIKQIIQDYKESMILNNGNQNDSKPKFYPYNSQFKHIMSRWQNNYEKLHYLSIFQNEPNLSHILENVMSSMNIPLDTKVFSEMRKYVESLINEEIKQQQTHEDANNFNINSKKYISIKSFKKRYINKYLVNKLIMEKLQSQEQLNTYSQWQILSLLSVDIFVNGSRDIINENMQYIIKKMLKINPLKLKISQEEGSQTKQYPFQIFKLILSNLNIYTTVRQNRLNTGKQLISQSISNESIGRWLIKSLIDYCKNIKNNQELMQAMCFLNSWNVDLLKLIESNKLNIDINLQNLAESYVDIEILSLFFSQNIIYYNQNKEVNSPVYKQFNNQKIVHYISCILTSFQETHLMNNYGIYFQQQGQKILNIIRSLLLMIHEVEPIGSKTQKDVNGLLKKLKQLFEQFNKLYNKTVKYNKLSSGGKYSHLYNNDQGNVIDVHNKINFKTLKNPYNAGSPDQMSVNMKIFSNFTEILEIQSMIRLSRWSSIEQFSSQHLDFIKKINEQISKRQRGIALHSDLTYFIDVEKLIEIKQFKEIGLKLYIKTKSPNRLILYYFVYENHSLLYNYENQQRQRIIGQEQLTINYLQSVVKVSLGQKIDVQIKIVPQKLQKEKLRILLEK